ncbi:MAG: tetratricopeptide repeat protein [candidate division WOR-3 bacterium]
MQEGRIDWFLEFNRQWAEALLLHEEKQFILLSERERKLLQNRAKGILPTEEEELFKEILSIPDFSPGEILRHPGLTFKEKINLLKRFGPHVPFAFLLSVLAADEKEEIIELGKFFCCCRRLLGEEKEPVLQAAPKGKISEEFERRFRFLSSLHEKFLRYRPKIRETSLALKESLEIYSSAAKKRELNNFFLSLIEGYILLSFGFDCHFQVSEAGMNIVIVIDQKPIYWETSSPAPLSFTPIPRGRTIDFHRFLLYFVYHHKEKSLRKKLKNLLFLYENLEKKEIGDGLFAQELASLFFLEKDYLKAEDFAQEAMCFLEEGDSQRAVTYSLLGTIYTYREDFKRALSAYQAALMIKPDDPEIHANLGAVYMKMGEKEKARLAFNSALALSPKTFSALYNLGLLCLAEGDYKNSINYLEKATKINGHNPSLFYTLACVYYEKGDLQKAETNFRKVIDLDANNAYAWYNLGIVYRDRGEKDKAVRALERAITLNPNLLK